MQQAEAEYKDFITFSQTAGSRRSPVKSPTFITGRWKSPIGDFNQAMRAEDEYKSLIKQFPDSKLVPRPSSGCGKCRKCWRSGYRIAHFFSA